MAYGHHGYGKQWAAVVPIGASGGGGPPPLDWILAGGTWTDANIWRDDQLWID